MKFDMVIFDDGLQEKWINYDIKFACFDSEKWIGNGHLIPSGPLREKMNALKNYHGIFLKTVNDDSNLDYIYNKIREINPNIEVFESNIEIKNISKFNVDKNYIIFSGIGNPDSFRKLLLKNKFKIIEEITFPDHYNYQDKDILRIKVLGEKIVNGEIHKLESNFDYLFSIVNGKINEGIIKNLFTTIRNDNKKIDISFKIPDRVLTGSKYDIDIILDKPLENLIIAGAIKPHQINSFFEQEILLEPLASGGIFKMTRAPSKPGIQIWSGIIAHPEGMITFTKSIDIVDKI